MAESKTDIARSHSRHFAIYLTTSGLFGTIVSHEFLKVAANMFITS